MVFVVCPLLLDKLLSVCLEIRAINLKLSCLCIQPQPGFLCLLLLPLPPPPPPLLLSLFLLPLLFLHLPLSLLPTILPPPSTFLPIASTPPPPPPLPFHPPFLLTPKKKYHAQAAVLPTMEGQPGQSEKAQPSDQDISQTLASENHHVDGATEPGKRKRRKKSELTLSFACTMCDNKYDTSTALHTHQRKIHE